MAGSAASWFDTGRGARKDVFSLLPEAEAVRIHEHEQWIMALGHSEVAEESIKVGASERIYSTTKTPYRDASGDVVGLIGVARDITDTKRLEAELHASNRELERRRATLEELATRDELTGLYNRRELKRLIDAELSRSARLSRPLSVAVLYPETGSGDAATISERLRHLVAATPFLVRRGASMQSISVKISVGVATYPGSGSCSFDALIGAADRALYEAKQRGRNRMIVAKD